MDQGCVNEGNDKRVWGKVTCWLQRHGSFKSKWPPLSVELELPLGVRVYFPWMDGKYYMVRIAVLRYDYYAGEYIFFSAAGKVVDPESRV